MLTPKEFEVLFLLVKRAGSVVEKDELLDAVWNDTFVEEATLTRNISFLRKKLGAGGEVKFIETVPKRGYRFAVEVAVTDANSLFVEEQTLTRITVEETISLPEVQESRKGEISALAGAAENQPAALPENSPPVSFRSSLILLTILGIVIVAAVSFVIYQNIFAQKSRAILTSRVVPFSGLTGKENYPAFSPDGRQMAFSWNGGSESMNFDLYIKIIGAGDPVRLTDTQEDEIHPTFSPDGTHIAFIRSSTTTSEVILIPTLGGAERKLLTRQTISSGISFSPDGKTLAVTDKDPENTGTAIFLFDIETGEKKRVTSPPEFSEDRQPRFSPDGMQIAFVRAYNWLAHEIYVLSIEDDKTRELTQDKKQILGLSWTADGKHIVFSSSRASNKLNLWQIRAAGGEEPVLIVTGRESPSHPAISPDGKRIAFTDSSTEINIWRITPGVGNSEKYEKLIASSQDDHSPVLAPDGKRIAFSSNRTGNYEIWTADTTGKNQRQLTDFKTSDAGSPRFSPDGKQIAFDASISGNGEVFLINAEGGSPRNLTANAAHDALPAWSADGKFVYFASNRSGEWQIWKIAATGGEAVQITRQGGFESFASPDGREIFYTKSRDKAGIWKVPAEGGEETAVPELAEAGFWRYWTVATDGIYYAARSQSPPYAIRFYDFQTRQVTDLTTAQNQPIWTYPGLAASPGNKILLYAQSDQSVSNIMLAELQ